jgi:hypothetical protein
MAFVCFEKPEIYSFQRCSLECTETLAGARCSLIHADVFRLSASHQCRLFKRVAIPSTLRAIQCSILRQPFVGY